MSRSQVNKGNKLIRVLQVKLINNLHDRLNVVVDFLSSTTLLLESKTMTHIRL